MRSNLAEHYIADLVAHGNDTVYTPMFNNRHEILPRPAQLLRVHRTAPDQYAFDFTDVRKWIHLDAMSDLHYATERLSDMPIASIVTAPDFIKADKMRFY